MKKLKVGVVCIIGLLTFLILSGLFDKKEVVIEESAGSIYGDEIIATANPSTDFEFVNVDDTIKIVKYIGISDIVVVPDRINDIPVVKIEKKAFIGNERVTKIVLPNTIRDIGDEAFSFCYGLSELVINKGVVSTGKNICTDCYSLKKVKIAGISDIEGMFMNCTNLTEITLPSGVKNISNAFYGCINLESVTLPDGLENITNAFVHCEKLTTISLPESIIYMEHAFSYSAITSIDIPQKTASIAGAFTNCDNLTQITIPDNIRNMSEAFSDCDGLTSIVIPENIDDISSAFFNCDNLQTATVPKSVTSTFGTFKNCKNLTAVTLSDELAIIGNDTFLGCISLANIAIPHGITAIGENAFNGCTSLSGIAISDKITTIDNNAFDGCTNLSSVTIGGPCKAKIGNQAFNNCGALTTIEIPEGVTGLGNDAFAGCTGLTSVILPTSINNTNVAIFSGCSAVRTLTVGGAMAAHISSSFPEYRAITSITFLAGTDSIGSLQGFSNLTSVDLPSSLRTITSFANCTSLNSLTIPSNVNYSSCSGDCFSGCPALGTIRILNGNADSIERFAVCLSSSNYKGTVSTPAASSFVKFAKTYGINVAER